MNGEYQSYLTFADGIGLIYTCLDKLQVVIKELNQACNANKWILKQP